jgi:hypothetical protein
MTGATRQNIFKLRRSNVSGKIPTTSQLLVGELAVNTQDGFLFTAISDSGGTTTTGVRQIGWDRLSTLSGGTVNGPVSINNILSATTYYGDGSNLTGVSNGITLTIEWKFSTSTSNSDPGSGNFRYNNTIPSGVTEIYVDNITNNGVDLQTILSKIKSGFDLYIQQKDDSTKAFLFNITNNSINNSGWYTIPVSYISNGTGGLPQNNRACTFVLFNSSTGGSSSGSTTDNFVTGGTFNSTTRDLTLNRTNGSVIITGFTDNFVTGGTLNRSTDTLTLFRQNGNVNITGITDTFLTGGTFNSTTRTITLSQNEGAPNITITGITDTFVTGLTVSNSVLTLSQNNGQSGITATIGLKTKVGSLSGGTFAGNPKTATVTFTSNFSDSNYAILLTGGANRTYTYENQSVSGFTINANANPTFTTNVYWQAISYGETL